MSKTKNVPDFSFQKQNSFGPQVPSCPKPRMSWTPATVLMVLTSSRSRSHLVLRYPHVQNQECPGLQLQYSWYSPRPEAEVSFMVFIEPKHTLISINKCYYINKFSCFPLYNMCGCRLLISRQMYMRIQNTKRVTSTQV
jgi:hypothetical protein